MRLGSSIPQKWRPFIISINVFQLIVGAYKHCLLPPALDGQEIFSSLQEVNQIRRDIIAPLRHDIEDMWNVCCALRHGLGVTILECLGKYFSSR